MNIFRPAMWFGVAGLMLVLLSLGCPLGKAQLPVDEHPARFFDASTGQPIDRVLMMPKYRVSTGLSVGVRICGQGNGRSYMQESQTLASPFVYRPGEMLAVPQPSSHGLLVPMTAFMGRIVELDGVVVMAPGYQPIFVWELWGDHLPPNGFQMVPLSERDSRSSAERWSTLLASRQIRGRDLTKPEQDALSLPPDFDADVRFNADERRMTNRFLANR